MSQSTNNKFKNLKRKEKNHRNNYNNLNNKLTRILVILILVLLLLNISSYSILNIDVPDNVIIDKNTKIINLSSLTTKQKIAQMTIVYGTEKNIEFYQDMLIGGVHIDTQASKNDVIKHVKKFQDTATIPFITTVDMEGCLNPFEKFFNSPEFKTINSTDAAYDAGYHTGKELNEMGITMNFAPVVDLEDKVFHCRSFPGTPNEIAEKSKYYIKGLQENNVMAVAKHYPGQTLSSSDPHKAITHATITENDLIPFKESMANGIDAIMVSHLIVNGSTNSYGMPAIVSKELIKEIKNEYNGLTITDEIGMLGLANYYYAKGDINQMFIDLYNSGADMILTFDKTKLNLKRMINAVNLSVERGEIDINHIDSSVTKILEAKGYTVVN